MGNILIFDADSDLAIDLEHRLREVSCRTFVCTHKQQMFDVLKKHQLDVAILICGVSVDWKAAAASLRNAVRQLHSQPQIVCVLRRPYNGPSDRLYGARQGVRVIYEKQ